MSSDLMRFMGGGLLGMAVPAWGDRLDYLLPQQQKPKQASSPAPTTAQLGTLPSEQLPQAQMPAWLMGLGGLT